MVQNYKKIDLPCGSSIDTAVKVLLEHKEKGELVSVNFNGHTLYSDTVTMSGAYLEITGKTKAELDTERNQAIQKHIREDEDHKAKIPELSKEWITKGHKIINQKYWLEWDKCVPIRLADLYQGLELEACLDIIEPLNRGCSLDEAKEIIEKQNHSGCSFGLVIAMVKSFCDRGQEFVNYVG